LLTVGCWFLLIQIYKPDDVKRIPVIVTSKTSLVTKDYIVICLSLLAILGWSTLEFTKPFLGDNGIVSLIFITIAFGSGLLTVFDFNSFQWHALFLLGGGSVLGKAVTSTHLLNYLVQYLFATLPVDNTPLLLVCILSFCLIIATFISHTVAALIIMPLLVEFGEHVGKPYEITITAAMTISAGMMFPFSSFPNIVIKDAKDDMDKPYLKTIDFIRAGLPMSVLSAMTIGSIGYGLIHLLFNR
jgi:di/tricarboxylate transporter